jgi:hypothetical protein
MLYALAYIAFALIIAFFLLPVVIGLKLERLSDTPGLRLDGALFGGAFGISLALFTGVPRRLSLLFLGYRLVSVALRTKAKPSTPRVMPSPAPPKPETPSSPLGERLSAMGRWFLKPGLQLLRSLPLVLTVKKLHASGSFGLGDPAQTGSAFGFLQALKTFYGRRLRLELQPDFVRAGFRGTLEVRLHLHLGLLLLLLLRTALQVAGRWLAMRLTWFPWKPGFTY